ncbi:MAG: hypothetical protein J6T16_04635, partial [Opitutales bacterium]|nr:hypothetical protein [Opitutales bacterium]
MKRKIALASIVLAALFFAACAALFCMQTAVANFALKSSSPNSKIEKAGVGFFSTTLKGLEIETKDGSKLTVESAEMRHGFLPLCLLLKKLDIESLKISGAVLSLSGTPRTPEESKKDEGTGGKKGFFESFDLSVKNLEADIELRLPGETKIKAKIGGENPARDIASSEIFKLHSAELRFPAEVECRGEKFGLFAQILARGTPQQSRLDAKIELGGKTIFQASANASDFYKKIGATAQVRGNSRDFKSLAEGLPQMSLNIHSRAIFDADLNRAECDASMRADFENLREFSVYFDDANSASMAAEISLSKSGGEISAKKFAAGLGVNGSPAFSIACAKEFKLDIFDISKFPDSRLFELSLCRFDLGLLNAFIRQNGFEVSAAPVSGSIEISKSGSIVEAKCKNPIPVKNLSLFRNGAPVVSGASFSLFASGATDFKKSSAAIQISPIKNDSDFVGTIEFAADSASKTIRLRAGGNPSPLFPRAKECGAEKAEADALAVVKGETAKIKNLEISVLGKGGANILKAKSKSEFSIVLSGRGAQAQNAEIEISSDCLPSEILSAVCPGASAEKFGFFAGVKIENGQSASAVFSASAKNFSYSGPENYLLQNLDLELEGSADFSGGLLKIEAKKFRALENATGILTSSGCAVFDFSFPDAPIFKSGKFEASASVPKMMRQPALKPFDNAATGLAEISASAESPEKIEACVAFSNLSARGNADVLGRASLDIKASLKDFSPQKASAKFRIATTKGETLAFAEAEFSDSVSAKIDAEKIVVEDARTLIEAFISRLPARAQKGKTAYIRPKILKGAENLPDSKQIRSSIKKKLLP